MDASRVHIDRSPAWCPYCKGAFEAPATLVACAACGARHHAECHGEHGKCATCGATERLVPEGKVLQGPTPRAVVRGPTRLERAPLRFLGGVLVVAAFVSTVLFIKAQSEDPRHGLFVMCLAFVALMFGLGMYLLRHPGGPSGKEAGPGKDEQARDS